MKNKVLVFCNNKVCPYRDCELRLKEDSLFRHITVIDLQSSCKRLANYLAKQINKYGNGSSL